MLLRADTRMLAHELEVAQFASSHKPANLAQVCHRMAIALGLNISAARSQGWYLANDGFAQGAARGSNPTLEYSCAGRNCTQAAQAKQALLERRVIAHGNPLELCTLHKGMRDFSSDLPDGTALDWA